MTFEYQLLGYVLFISPLLSSLDQLQNKMDDDNVITCHLLADQTNLNMQGFFVVFAFHFYSRALSLCDFLWTSVQKCYLQIDFKLDKLFRTMQYGENISTILVNTG